MTIHCPTLAPTTDRINAAWTDCGAQGTLDTVQQLTGIPVNYLITLDFHGFKLIVNKLHGVYMNVDHRYYIAAQHRRGSDQPPCRYQRLDGGDALDFVRFRETDNDLYRNARQQLFLEALKDRLKSSLTLFQIPQLIGAVKKSVEIARGGSTGTPSMSEIQSYVGLGENLKPGHMFRVTIDNLQSCGFANAQICANPSDIAAAVDSFMHPDITVAARANAAALGRKLKKPKQSALKPAQITTLVLNGTTIGGLARDTSYKLAVAGFHTVQLPPTTPADTPTATYTSSYVYFDSVQPNAKAAAQQLKVAMGPNTLLAPLPPEIVPYAQQANNPLAVVVVGTAFSGELVNPAAHIVPVQPHQPPNVRTAPEVTLGPVEAVRSKVRFRIMVPTRARASSISARSSRCGCSSRPRIRANSRSRTSRAPATCSGT